MTRRKPPTSPFGRKRPKTAQSQKGATRFTRAQLERQRDVALDFLVSLIDAFEAIDPDPSPTPLETQVTLNRVMQLLPELEAAEPAAVIVLNQLATRLIMDRRTREPR